MAIWTVRSLDQLVGALVIGPERYDPRRELTARGEATTSTIGDLVVLNRKTVNASTAPGECVILDTNDAREGVVTIKAPIPVAQIGSQKKVAAAGDVIISRLRPYLRQAAFVDAEAITLPHPLLVSSEFFVLRPVATQSVAFLVPLLLSKPVQAVLAAAQEGGHHPRFDEQTLLNVPVPSEWLNQRDALSAEVEQAVALYRQYQVILRGLTQQAEALLPT